MDEWNGIQEPLSKKWSPRRDKSAPGEWSIRWKTEVWARCFAQEWLQDLLALCKDQKGYHPQSDSSCCVQPSTPCHQKDPSFHILTVLELPNHTGITRGYIYGELSCTPGIRAQTESSTSWWLWCLPTHLSCIMKAHSCMCDFQIPHFFKQAIKFKFPDQWYGAIEDQIDVVNAKLTYSLVRRFQMHLPCQNIHHQERWKRRCLRVCLTTIWLQCRLRVSVRGILDDSWKQSKTIPCIYWPLTKLVLDMASIWFHIYRLHPHLQKLRLERQKSRW